MHNIQNYKAIAFFDLDGTLLNANSGLDTEVIDALHQIKANGVLPLIATGRANFELENIMELANITGAITMNGQYIILDEKTIYKEAIPTEIITQLLNETQNFNEEIVFYDGDHSWVTTLTDFVKKAYSYPSIELPVVDKTYHFSHEVNMLLILTDKLSQVAHYKERIPELNFFMNSPFSIDVTNSATNKGTGVNHIKEFLGFTGETYAFGDGRNDLDLFNACDHKTAMGNAVPELKELADFISSANTDHGIINAFNYWGLL